MRGSLRGALAKGFWWSFEGERGRPGASSAADAWKGSRCLAELEACRVAGGTGCAVAPRWKDVWSLK